MVLVACFVDLSSFERTFLFSPYDRVTRREQRVAKDSEEYIQFTNMTVELVLLSRILPSIAFLRAIDNAVTNYRTRYAYSYNSGEIFALLFLCRDVA